MDNDGLGGGEYVYHGLGTAAIDGQWHTFVRDLQADLAEAQPGVAIVEVNGFWIRGTGRVDDIRLSANPPTTYEDAEDGTIGGWEIYDTFAAGAEITNVFDVDRQSRVIQLVGAGTNNGYRLQNGDGSTWQNASQFVMEWSMNYAEFFTVYIDVETTAGHR